MTICNNWGNWGEVPSSETETNCPTVSRLILVQESIKIVLGVIIDLLPDMPFIGYEIIEEDTLEFNISAISVNGERSVVLLRARGDTGLLRVTIIRSTNIYIPDSFLCNEVVCIDEPSRKDILPKNYNGRKINFFERSIASFRIRKNMTNAD